MMRSKSRQNRVLLLPHWFAWVVAFLSLQAVAFTIQPNGQLLYRPQQKSSTLGLQRNLKKLSEHKHVSSQCNSQSASCYRPSITSSVSLSLSWSNNNNNGNSNENKKGGNGRSDELPNPPRFPTNFGNLFQGMPSMGDIFGGSSGDTVDESDDDDDDEDLDLTVSPRKKRDDSWFDEEKQEIIKEYDDVIADMVTQLQEQRRKDPTSTPPNAEAMIKSIMNEDMEREITLTRDDRARERLSIYEQNLKSKMATENSDKEEPNELVGKLMDEDEATYEQQESSMALVDEFLEYEEHAYRKAAKASKTSERPESLPKPGQNLDAWALEQLEKMASDKQEVDGGELVLDNLEDNIDTLRERIENRSIRRVPEQLGSMKEWQMFRSIATRLVGNEGKEAELEKEQEILQKLDSWKDYIKREEKNREISGLTRGPKLPFEWQEYETKQTNPSYPDKEKRTTFRKRINRMSIEALENLLHNTDSARKEVLQKEVDYLKATLESHDYLDPFDDVDKFENDQLSGSIDLSDVFSNDAESKMDKVQSDRQEKDRTHTLTSRSPPTTTFFDDLDMLPSQKAELSVQKAKPSTPFFSDNDCGDDGIFESKAEDDSKLGSFEEQRLDAMYRRANARTAKEQEIIRKQWLDFQALEQTSREQSGLSGNDHGVDNSTYLYNMSKYLRDDGEIDADKILSVIGPRPSRTKRSTSSLKSTLLGQKSVEIENEDLSLKPKVDEDEVLGSMFRAVSAIGGGRLRDDFESRQEFEDFIRKENDYRRTLDHIDTVAGEELKELKESADGFDDIGYAHDVITSLGPRPKPKRTRAVDEKELSDMGGKFAVQVGVQEQEENRYNNLDEPMNSSFISANDTMPDWLRKEELDDKAKSSGRGAFLGSDIDEVFADDPYDKNLRQLHEYEQRRSGHKRQMGIDISDILGRRSFESDDYADYKFDDNRFRRIDDGGWGTNSFEARKRHLLEYTELDITELNSLMDHKDSVYSTGVSQYLPRINKPFKDFGAVFRLEGVLVDITGLQMKAWTKVAEEFHFKSPDLDDVRRAAVIRPEMAVKSAFFWTDDFFECKKIALRHRAILRGFLQEWAVETGLLSEHGKDKANALGVHEKTDSAALSRSNGKKNVGSTTRAWQLTAQAFGRTPPSQVEAFRAASLSPDVAIQEAFKWSDNSIEISRMVQSYRAYLSSLSQDDNVAFDTSSSMEKQEEHTVMTLNSQPSPLSTIRLSEAEMMEAHYFAWQDVANFYNFEPPEPDEVMAAFVINDLEVAVRDGFGWSDDEKTTEKVVQLFRRRLQEILSGTTNNNSTQSTQQLTATHSLETKSNQSQADSVDLSGSEYLQSHLHAWTAAAQAHGFLPPSIELVDVAIKVDPKEAITRIFGWSEDEDYILSIIAKFEEELKSTSNKAYDSYKLRAQDMHSPKLTSIESPGPSSDDIFRTAYDSWTAVAKKRSLPEPDLEQIVFALSVGPEEAIVTGFEWASDRPTIQELIDAYRTELGIRRQSWVGRLNTEQSITGKSENNLPLVQVVAEGDNWIKSLRDVEMPCGIISYLDKDQVDLLIAYAGLSDLINPNCRVTLSNGYPTDSQHLLGAALRLERRPDHCVVFDCSPYASIAAHEVDMRNVNLIGPYPRYEFLAADSTASTFHELTAMNIRRLFGERVFDQPQFETQESRPDLSRRTKTLFWDDN